MTPLVIVQLLWLVIPGRQGYPCLPPGLKPSDVVSAERTREDPPRSVTITVEQRLKQLRARCLRRGLVDGKGREIQFYRVHCFGAPTAYALETMRRDRAHLEALRKRYSVIELTCNASGAPTP